MVLLLDKTPGMKDQWRSGIPTERMAELRALFARRKLRDIHPVIEDTRASLWNLRAARVEAFNHALRASGDQIRMAQRIVDAHDRVSCPHLAQEWEMTPFHFGCEELGIVKRGYHRHPEPVNPPDWKPAVDMQVIMDNIVLALSQDPLQLARKSDMVRSQLAMVDTCALFFR